MDNGPDHIQRLAEARVGQVVAGRYRLGRLLGWGGMGMVFEAEHVTIRRPLAVKLLHASYGDVADAARRFEREAVTAGRLKHPNCVGVSDFGQLEDGSLYLVMELLTGSSLGAVLDQQANGRLPPARAIHIARQILRGLAHAHSLGVVHRDVKPDNVFLIERDGDPDFVKLLDFGIAKLVGDAAAGTSQLTQAGSAVGTPRYLAPEQVLGGDLDGRADLYSTTVVLYEMISGRTPFEGDPVAVVKQHLTSEPPPIAEVAPDVPISPVLAAVVRRGLGKSRDQRYASAEEYLAALDGCPEALGRSEARAGAPRRTAGQPVDIRPFLKRTWKRIAIAAGAFLALVTILSLLLGKSRDEELEEALRRMHSGERCEDRRAAVARLRELGDPRAIPALRDARGDRCLSDDASAAIDALESQPGGRR